MAYGVSNGHVTICNNVTWPRKVLWGSTVGYPSDSLASCLKCMSKNVVKTQKALSKFSLFSASLKLLTDTFTVKHYYTHTRICHTSWRQAAGSLNTADCDCELSKVAGKVAVAEPEYWGGSGVNVEHRRLEDRGAEAGDEVWKFLKF